MQFGQPADEGDFVYKNTPWSDWYDLAEKIFLVVAMLAAVLIIRSLLNRVRTRVNPMLDYEETFATGQSETVAGALPHKKTNISLPAAEEEISEEALLREEKRKRISDYMKDKPEDAVRLLKVWLAED
jgi:flagellar biosynthesis/type III secretory pathway M-ring protein FliF/YscJ